MKIRYRIHYTLPNGEEDWFTATGETIEEIREIAQRGVDQRGGTNPWSERLNDEDNC